MIAEIEPEPSLYEFSDLLSIIDSLHSLSLNPLTVRVRFVRLCAPLNPCVASMLASKSEGGRWLIAGHPSQDGKAVAAIEKITIADTDHLSDSWFKTEILGGLNGADVEFLDPSANGGEYGIIAVQLTTPTGSVVLN